MNQLDVFETRLLAELRTIAEQPEERPTPRSAHLDRRRGPWAIAAAAAAAVAGALALVPTLQAEPAWAVSSSGDGRVDVQVNRIEDADGLERALADEGIAADVTYLADGGRCAPGRYTAVPSSGVTVSVGSDQSFQISIPPGEVPDGAVLVIAASSVPLPDVQHDDGARSTDGFRTWVDVGVSSGAVDDCVVVPAQD